MRLCHYEQYFRIISSVGIQIIMFFTLLQSVGYNLLWHVYDFLGNSHNIYRYIIVSGLVLSDISFSFTGNERSPEKKKYINISFLTRYNNTTMTI